MVPVHNQCCALLMSSEKTQTLHQVQAVVPKRSSEFQPHQDEVIPDACVEVMGLAGAGGSRVLPVSHSSSPGLTQSCLLSADELEMLGGMERTWHGSCSLGMRADPDKRISKDG